MTTCAKRGLQKSCYSLCGLWRKIVEQRFSAASVHIAQIKPKLSCWRRQYRLLTQSQGPATETAINKRRRRAADRIAADYTFTYSVSDPQTSTTVCGDCSYYERESGAEIETVDFVACVCSAEGDPFVWPSKFCAQSQLGWKPVGIVTIRLTDCRVRDGQVTQFATFGGSAVHRVPGRCVAKTCWCGGGAEEGVRRGGGGGGAEGARGGGTRGRGGAVRTVYGFSFLILHITPH